MAALERLGGQTWFKLGDRDLATHVLRTEALAAGRTLSEVTGAAGAPPRHRTRGRADERRSGPQHRRHRRRRARLPGLFRAAAVQAQVSRRDIPRCGERETERKASAKRSTARMPSSSRRPIRSSASIRSWRCRVSKSSAPIATAGRRGFADRRRQGGERTARQDDARARRRTVRARRGATLRPAGQRLDHRRVRIAISHQLSKRSAAGSRSAIP